MTNLTTQFDRLQHQINQSEILSRYKYQQQLGRLIASAEAQGAPVPSVLRCLNEELMIEAIEAQFENMPV